MWKTAQWTCHLVFKVNPQILYYIHLVCKDSPLLEFWFLWEVITRNKAVLFLFPYFSEKVPLGHYLLHFSVPFMLLYVVNFFYNSVSFENRSSLHFSTARPMSLRVFPLFTLTAKKLRAKSEV